MYKPRIINTTDLGADPDDEQSLVRYFVSANEFDTEGLIVVTSCWKKQQSSTIMLDRLIDAYEKVLPNLQVHGEGFPTADYLRSITKLGQTGFGMADVGNGKDTDGSELIIHAADQDDPRPLWITLWGGANTVAQAIWKVRATRSERAFQKFIQKIRIYDILGQDDAGAWMCKNFPELLYIRAKDLVYGWQPTPEWVHEHIMSHGELGRVYPEKEWTYEGDTPAYLYLYPNGLSDPDKVHWGSWGGRFDPVKRDLVRGMGEEVLVQIEPNFDSYSMYSDADEGGESMKCWKEDIENDFQARMDWSICNQYEDANHHPLAVINGDTSRKVLTTSVSAGSTFHLSAEGSSDPDGDDINYTWLYYKAPGTYDGSIEFSNNNGPLTSITIPKDASGKELHIVLRVADNGVPSLCTYRRAVISVC